MKRSDARNLVRQALDPTTRWIHLRDQDLDAVLDALPLDLEPDEQPLPDVLDCLVNVSTDIKYFNGVLLHRLGREDGPRVYVTGCGSFETDQRFAEEVRQGYNRRRAKVAPRWKLDENLNALCDVEGCVDVSVLLKHPIARRVLRRIVRDANGVD